MSYQLEQLIFKLKASVLSLVNYIGKPYLKNKTVSEDKTLSFYFENSKEVILESVQLFIRKITQIKQERNKILGSKENNFTS